MKRFKRIGSKVMAFLIALAVMCSLVQLPVYAASGTVDWEDGKEYIIDEGETLQVILSMVASEDVSYYYDDVLESVEEDVYGLTYGNRNSSVDTYNNVRQVKFRNDTENNRKAIYAYSTYPVTSITVSPTETTLKVGESSLLQVTFAPEENINKNVTWTSSDNTVATVSSAGEVEAKSAGIATITATTEDGSKTAACAVTVEKAGIPVTGITLNKTIAFIKAGESETLVATVAPENATNKKVIWSSSDTSVATVSESGEVTTLKMGGSATITATTEDGNKTATCNVIGAQNFFYEDFVITGTVGKELPATTLTLKTFKTALNVGDDYTEMIHKMITNLPAELKAAVTAVSEDNSTVKISITGTPAKKLVENATFAAGITPNENCSFNITEAAPTPTPTPNEQETPKNNPVTQKTSSPKTGDTLKTIPYFSLLALSGCAFVYVFRKKRSLKK